MRVKVRRGEARVRSWETSKKEGYKTALNRDGKEGNRRSNSLKFVSLSSYPGYAVEWKVLISGSM